MLLPTEESEKIWKDQNGGPNTIIFYGFCFKVIIILKKYKKRPEEAEEDS